ncbi:hypothetical protein MMC16_002522 [Acarospora aff. strigata]|nr:hypothetical protein [Acarospora aff. strigata]
MAYYLRVLTSTLLVLSVYASVTASGSASQQRDGAAQARGPDRKRDGPATDHLASAVPLRSSIESRDVGQAALRQDSVFRDVVDDGPTRRTPTQLAAPILRTNNPPLVALESLSHKDALSQIYCSASRIEFWFCEMDACRAALKALGTLSSFTLLASQKLCHGEGEGERSSYLVSSISFSEDKPVIILTAKSCPWKDLYLPLLSSNENTPKLRRQVHIQRMQTSSSSTTSTVPSPSSPLAVSTPSSTRKIMDNTYRFPTPDKSSGASILEPWNAMGEAWNHLVWTLGFLLVIGVAFCNL